ncbi:MAG: hypothetical protein ACRCW0_06910 [Clostridium sp.]
MIEIPTIGIIGLIFILIGIIKIIFKWCPNEKQKIEALCKAYNKNIEDIDERKHLYIDVAFSFILGSLLIIAAFIINISFIYSLIFIVISGIVATKIYYPIRDKYLNLK